MALGAEVAGCAFVVELDALGGRAQLADYRAHARALLEATSKAAATRRGVLLDPNMPHLGGMEVLARVKQDLSRNLHSMTPVKAA